MSYVTPAQLAEIPGALELSQVASDDQRMPVPADLMDLTLRGGDRSTFDPDLVAQADAALARVMRVVAEADAIIDGYLARRYAVPMTKQLDLLATWSRAITRYKLHGDRQGDERTDPIVRDYRDALKLLQLTADGKFSLGAEDPTTGPSAVGEFLFDPGRKVFGRDFLP